MWAMPELPKVRLLIARGANVNARSADLGLTPLLVAAGFPNTADILQLLVRRGADIRAKDKEGMHALGRAVLSADVETVRFLVENGTDMSDRRGFGEFGLGLYFARKDFQITEYLLSQDVKVAKEALAVAPNAQSVRLLDGMLAAGADVNAPIDAFIGSIAFKSTSLLMAVSAEQTRPEALLWLLEKGADPNAEDINGNRALDWATYRADQSRIDLLNRYGAKAVPRRAPIRMPPREAPTMPVLPCNGVRRCCFRLHQQSSRSVVALHVITKPCRCRSQRPRAGKGYLSTTSCWKGPLSR